MAREPRGAARDRDERDSEFVDRLVHINRVAKVVKGGRRFGFAALVVVGDQKGRVGFGHGKAREVPEAIRKATDAAKRGADPRRRCAKAARCITTSTAATAPARSSCARRPQGTGIIAGGPMRAVFETLGMQDVVAKSLGSSNPYNLVRATFDALKNEDSPRSVAARRGLKVSDAPGPPPRRRRRRRRRRGVREDGNDGRATQTVTVEQIGSPIRRDASQRQTLVGLGLNKIHRTLDLADTPAVRGMIEKVKHLVRVVDDVGRGVRRAP